MDQQREFVVEGELSSPEAPKKKKARWWVILIDAVMITVFLLSIAASSGVIYLSATYDVPFYVNGMSMYPTLNATAVNAQGKQLSWYNGSNSVGDKVDYGYAKSFNPETDTLSRYDVVITYYPSDFKRDLIGDFVRDSDGKLILLSGHKTKIKRVIGLPGESVSFDTVEDDTEMYNRAWGKTTINLGLENEQILKPLYTVDDFPSVDGRTYNFPQYSYGPTLLKEHQYYVMGDNRGQGYSSDSREVGPILDEMIVAKAELIVGLRTLDAEMTPGSPWEYIFTPWNFRRLG